ncbi:MAG: hypothetical protein IAE80_15815 [Anaerolinea sp.]|nr:hypothetical protein [Anaerolinea sp.]
MAIQVYWQDEQKNMIRCSVSGRWTWDDLQKALSQTISMMDSVNHKVNFIIDLRNGSFVINPLSLLGQTRSFATPETHRNEGVKVVIGANGLVQTAYDGYRRVTSAMGKNQVFHFADTEAQAHQIIEREQ